MPDDIMLDEGGRQFAMPRHVPTFASVLAIIDLVLMCLGIPGFVMSILFLTLTPQSDGLLTLRLPWLLTACGVVVQGLTLMLAALADVAMLRGVTWAGRIGYLRIVPLALGIAQGLWTTVLLLKLSDHLPAGSQALAGTRIGLVGGLLWMGLGIAYHVVYFRACWQYDRWAFGARWGWVPDAEPR